MVKNLPTNAGDAGDMGSIPGSGRSLGGGNGNPHQHFCLENSMDSRSQHHSPWGCKESDMTECLITHIYIEGKKKVLKESNYILIVDLTLKCCSALCWKGYFTTTYTINPLYYSSLSCELSKMQTRIPSMSVCA